jgi:hypothetical protein
MQIKFPTPPQGGLANYFASVFKTLQQALNPAISATEEAPRLILQSEDRSIYFLTVEDDGTLRVRSKDGLPRF